jgi:hypothetical protein
MMSTSRLPERAERRRLGRALEISAFRSRWARAVTRAPARISFETRFPLTTTTRRRMGERRNMEITTRTCIVFFLYAVSIGCHRDENGAQPSASAAPPPVASEKPAPSAEAAPRASSAAVRAHGRARRDGLDPLTILLHTTSELTLSAAQQTTMDALEAQQERSTTETRTALTKLRQDLAAGVATGTLDNAQLKTDESAVEEALKARAASEASALNALHAALDTVERKTVLDLTRARLPMLTGSGATPGTMPDAGRGEGWADPRRRLESWTSDLDLEPEQKSRATTALAKLSDDAARTAQAQRDERRKRMETLLTAFSQDLFDAKTALPPAKSSPQFDIARQDVTFVTQLLPTLHPIQRDKLARNVQRAAARTPRTEGSSDEAPDPAAR